jgi:hypothetical protein
MEVVSLGNQEVILEENTRKAVDYLPLKFQIQSVKVWDQLGIIVMHRYFLLKSVKA